MRLLSLALKNFKGHKDLDVHFGDVTTISGANGTGKTTVFDAFCWLLTGKDSLGRVCGTGQKGEATIRPRESDGELVRVVEVSVTGRLMNEDGEVDTLQRIFCEQYSTDKNSGEKFFKGNTTKYFINGVPTPAAKYDAWVKEHMNPETLKLTSDPAYFPGLPWQDQRALLLQIAGDVDDAAVIAAVPELKPLENMIARHSVEDIKAMATSQLKLANKAVKEGMIRIDQTVALAGNFTEADLAAEIARHEEMVKAQDEAVTRAESAFAKASVEDAHERLKRELEDVGQKFVRVREKFDAAWEVARRKTWELTLDHTRKKARVKEDMDSIANRHLAQMRYISDLGKEKEELYKKYDQVYGESIDVSGPCPYCGQPLPEEKRNETLSKFKRDKALRLEAIVKKGKGINELLAQAEADGEDLHAAFLKKEAEYNDLKAQDGITSPEEKALAGCKVEDLPEYKALVDQQKKIEQELAGAAVVDTSAERANLDEARKIRDSLQAKLGELQGKMKILQSIATLKDDLQKQRENADTASATLRLVTQFTITKCHLLTDKVNTLFPGLEWRLFQQNVTNDDIVETCELTMHGVQYRDLSQGEKIRAGLVIVNTLQEKLQILNPVWVDGAESITFTLEVKSQLVLLKAQENINQLKMEVK